MENSFERTRARNWMEWNRKIGKYYCFPSEHWSKVDRNWILTRTNSDKNDDNGRWMRITGRNWKWWFFPLLEYVTCHRAQNNKQLLMLLCCWLKVTSDIVLSIHLCLARSAECEKHISAPWKWNLDGMSPWCFLTASVLLKQNDSKSELEGRKLLKHLIILAKQFGECLNFFYRPPVSSTSENTDTSQWDIVQMELNIKTLEFF